MATAYTPSLTRSPPPRYTQAPIAPTAAVAPSSNLWIWLLGFGVVVIIVVVVLYFTGVFGSLSGGGTGTGTRTSTGTRTGTSTTIGTSTGIATGTATGTSTTTGTGTSTGTGSCLSTGTGSGSGACTGVIRQIGFSGNGDYANSSLHSPSPAGQPLVIQATPLENWTLCTSPFGGVYIYHAGTGNYISAGTSAGCPIVTSKFAGQNETFTLIQNIANAYWIRTRYNTYLTAGASPSPVTTTSSQTIQALWQITTVACSGSTATINYASNGSPENSALQTGLVAGTTLTISGPTSTWTICPTTGGNYLYNYTTGLYVSAGSSSTSTIVTVQDPGPNEVFTIIPNIGVTFFIQTRYGTYLAAGNPGSTVFQQASSTSALWQIF